MDKSFFSGIVPPIAVPIDSEERLDEARLRKHIDFMIDGGVSGILAFGSNGEFYMQDEEFKAQMFDEKISFASGMCIDCVLEIARRLSELGEVINVSYTVTTVIRTRFDKMEIITPQGKRHLRKLEAEKKQLTLDLFG